MKLTVQTFLTLDGVMQAPCAKEPLVLGSGRRLFGGGILPATMRPVSVSVADSGIVRGTYEPAGPVGTDGLSGTAVRCDLTPHSHRLGTNDIRVGL